MKEMHAYQNEDGTYRVSYIGYATANGELKEVKIELPRARLTVEAFPEVSSDTIFSVIVNDDSEEEVIK